MLGTFSLPSTSDSTRFHLALRQLLKQIESIWGSNEIDGGINDRIITSDNKSDEHIHLARELIVRQQERKKKEKEYAFRLFKTKTHDNGGKRGDKSKTWLSMMMMYIK